MEQVVGQKLIILMQNTPILVFCYKRLSSLQQTIKALEKCIAASESELYIFSDGAKTENDRQKVEEVRSYLKNVTGFKKVTIMESAVNKGLAASIIQGVTEVMKFSDKVIVLEDDLVVSGNFLTYMNQCLDFYEKNLDVFSIAGYSLPMKVPPGYEYDVYFSPRASSWGWGTWKNRWSNIDWNVSDFEEFSNNKQSIKLFNQGGSDMFTMLKNQMNKKLDSWAIRWCYHQFKMKTYTAFPIRSKVQNIGFTADATNTHVYNRYNTVLDDGEALSFNLPSDVELNAIFLKQFQSFYSRNTRIISRIKTYLLKAGFKNNG